MYPNLKLQLWKTGLRQNRLAQILGIHETLLSKIMNGFRETDSEMRARIAKVLKCDVEWLFAQELPQVRGRQNGDHLGAVDKSLKRTEL